MNKLVCVTGANGYVASWVVKFLLAEGYHVRGLVRSPEDKEKVGHLESLEGSKERLTLVKGDLLDCDSIISAIHGTEGVFHMACPVPSYTSTNPEVEVLNPAINGTLNVLRASKLAGVKRVVMTSSVTAVYADPNRPEGTIVDESCWSDEDYLRKNNHWYMLGKTLGEKAAWQYAKENNLDLVVVCPTLVLGSLLQSNVNSSTLALLKLLNGSMDTYEDATYGVIDVKDVAKAHIFLYENPSASGRYLCNSIRVERSDMLEIVKTLYPDLPLPKKVKESDRSKLLGGGISSKKLEELGFTFTPFEETIKDAVESFKSKGLIK